MQIIIIIIIINQDAPSILVAMAYTPHLLQALKNFSSSVFIQYNMCSQKLKKNQNHLEGLILKNAHFWVFPSTECKTEVKV